MVKHKGGRTFYRGSLATKEPEHGHYVREGYKTVVPKHTSHLISFSPPCSEDSNPTFYVKSKVEPTNKYERT